MKKIKKFIPANIQIKQARNKKYKYMFENQLDIL